MIFIPCENRETAKIGHFSIEEKKEFQPCESFAKTLRKITRELLAAVDFSKERRCFSQGFRSLLATQNLCGFVYKKLVVFRNFAIFAGFQKISPKNGMVYGN